MFFEIGVLRNFAIFTGKHQCWSLFLRKLQTLRPYGPQLYLKETSTQLFSCEYCKIFTNSVFYRTPPVGLTIKPGTPEHGTPAEQRNTPEQWRNNWTLPGTPAEHPGTTKPYKTKNNCRVFKRKFKTQSFNF